MLQAPSLSSLSFLISSVMFFVIPVSTTNSNVYFQCSQLNFMSMTPYESNVNSLFTSLEDSASCYHFNKFQTNPLSDTVYGLFQCRGDLSSHNCKECVANSISLLKTTCPMSTCGEIQLEGCFVKYDETPFFGDQDKMEVYRRCGPSIRYNADILNSIDGVLAYLVEGNGQYFRRGDLASIHGVAQCVQDLSLGDCQDCLLEARGRLRSECEASTWGEMYLGKCYIRYADHASINAGNENLAHSGNSGSKISHDHIVKLIGYIIAATVVGVGGFIFATKNYCSINVLKKVTNKLKNESEGVKKHVVIARFDANLAKGKADKAENDAKSAKDKAEKAENEAKLAKEKANKVEKKVEEEIANNISKMHVIYGPVMPMPPPCYYLLDSNPYSCSCM